MYSQQMTTYRAYPTGHRSGDLPHGQPRGVDILTVEELQAKLAEMTQEDEGATIRILQLERERDNALALVRHVHERHQSEHQQQEAQRQMHQRYLQMSEHEVHIQQVQAQELRDEAAQAVMQIGQQSQGEMFDMAKEYQRMYADDAPKSEGELGLAFRPETCLNS